MGKIKEHFGNKQILPYLFLPNPYYGALNPPKTQTFPAESTAKPHAQRSSSPRPLREKAKRCRRAHSPKAQLRRRPSPPENYKRHNCKYKRHRFSDNTPNFSDNALRSNAPRRRTKRAARRAPQACHAPQPSATPSRQP